MILRPSFYAYAKNELMNYRFCLSLLFLLSIGIQENTLWAQRPAAMVRKGEQAVQGKDYFTAIHYFQQALERKPIPDVQYRLAEAALAFKAYDLAVEQYELLLEGNAALQYGTAYLGMAQALQATGQYQSALDALQEFQSSGRGSKQQNALATSLKQSCEWALQQLQEEEWTLDRLGRRINSPYGEFGPWKSGDTLYYTSYRYEKKEDKYRPARKISKVLTTKDERSGRVMSRGFNQDTVLTAHTALNRSKELLFFNRCSYSSGAEISCQLCVRKKDRRKRWARDFLVLPEPVNSAAYTTTQPAIRWDSVTQTEYLLFVSNRSGGAGGFDIWEVPIPDDLKNWEIPRPLTGVNTAAAEMTPFFLHSDQKLYFSTDRSPGFGGFDLVAVQYLGEDKWGAYHNLGPAINSSYDDNYPFFVTAEQGYFSSNRPGGRYLDEKTKNCCPDLFKVQRVVNEPEELPTDSTAADVVVIDIPSAIEPPEPEPRTLEEFLPLTLYYDNDHPDPRTRRTSTKLSYQETYFTYLAREDEYYDQFTDEEKVQDELAHFFEKEVSKGFQNLERFSEILLEQLEADQSVEIFLKGFTSPRAKGDYNLLLGKRRVSAVKNHFISWRNGIFAQYLESGQLIISEVSFGETRAAATAQDEKAGERSSIYSPEAARERRVEIVEIKRN